MGHYKSKARTFSRTGRIAAITSAVLASTALCAASQAAGTSGNLLFTIPNPTPDHSGFGSAVAGLNASFVVGDPNNNTGASGAGSVYEYSATTGNLIATIPNPSPTFSTGFGRVLAPAGNNFLTEAVFARTNSATIFLVNGSNGTVIQSFSNSNWSFGSTLATFGGNVLVNTNNNGGTNGQMSLLSASSGTSLRTFQNPGVGGAGDGLGDQFGSEAATNASYVAVSAPYQVENGIAEAGAVYVYNGNTGALVRTITSPSDFNHFGMGLAISGNDILISGNGPFSSTGVSYPGIIMRYNLSTGALEATYTNPLPSTNAEIGTPLAFDGSDLMVGAPYKSAVYLMDGTTGSLLQQYTEPPPPPNQYLGNGFGYNFALSGNDLMVSDPSTPITNNPNGFVYIYDATVAPVPEPSSMAMLALCAVGLLGFRNRKENI